MLPAHPGLIPRPFHFSATDRGWTARLIQLTGAVKVERAQHAKPIPLGYYRLDLGERQGVRFGKVVHRDCAQRIHEAAELANACLEAGVPAVANARPLTLGDDHVLFLHPWIEGEFSRGTRTEMHSLGQGLLRLHAFLRSSGPPTAQPASFWVDSWRSLEDLQGNPGLNTEQDRGLRELLARRDEAQARLTSQAQRLHNDVHPGNVLFDNQGGLLAFLDFEEALTSWGSPWIDLAWVIERFCLTAVPLEAGQERARHFLHAYFPARGLDEDCRPMLQDAILWKNYHALGVLGRQHRLTGVVQQDEWEKFTYMLGIATHHIDPLVDAVLRPLGHRAGTSAG